MKFIQEFLAAYGLSMAYAAVTAVAGALGIGIKRMVERCRNDREKREVAEICVRAVEQVYRDLHGTEKFQKCAEAMAQMLAVRGVPVTDLEIKVLCEAVLSQLNGAFSQQSVVNCENE